MTYPRSTTILAAETGAELTQSLRAPEFEPAALALPLAFYLLFGVMLSGGASAATYLLATYGIFAVIGPAVFGFGVGVATERERGWLELKRATPVPAWTLITAKLLATLAFAALALMPIYIAAALLGDVALPRLAWLQLFGLHLAAVVPFSMLGLAIGFTFGANGAIAVANIVFLALAVVGGLWFPASLFPDWLFAITRTLPSYHLAEIALAVVDAGGERNIAVNAAVAGGLTLGLAALAGLAWSRQR